jgi:hypothetical protein
VSLQVDRGTVVSTIDFDLRLWRAFSVLHVPGRPDPSGTVAGSIVLTTDTSQATFVTAKTFAVRNTIVHSEHCPNGSVVAGT